jgi:hypothetical protein
VWAALIADHVSRMLINGFVFVFGSWTRQTGERVRPLRANEGVSSNSS